MNPIRNEFKAFINAFDLENYQEASTWQAIKKPRRYILQSYPNADEAQRIAKIMNTALCAELIATDHVDSSKLIVHEKPFLKNFKYLKEEIGSEMKLLQHFQKYRIAEKIEEFTCELLADQSLSSSIIWEMRETQYVSQIYETIEEAFKTAEIINDKICYPAAEVVESRSQPGFRVLIGAAQGDLVKVCQNC